VDKEPAQQEHRDDHECGQDQANACDEKPVRAGVLFRVGEGAGKQGVVAAIGTPAYVEEVTYEGDGADSGLNGDVEDHAGDDSFGDAAEPGGDDDDRRGEAAKDIADAGDEADDAVKAEPDGRAGNLDEVVEDVREHVELFVVECLATEAAARSEDLRFCSYCHGRSSPLEIDAFFAADALY
jgi:hypothetical protein